MNLYFDIETIPSEETWVHEDIIAKITVPGNYKKEETVAKWLAEEKPHLVEEAIRKTGVDTSLAQIICLSVAIDDEPPMVFANTEAITIKLFFDLFSEAKTPILIGHNITGFDVPLLYHRAIINGVRVPKKFPRPDTPPWNMDVADTMTMWSGHKNRISLDKLSKLLGFEGKNGMDGSDVYPAYLDGKLDEIADYCKHDVEMVRNVYKRITESNYG